MLQVKSRKTDLARLREKRGMGVGVNYTPFLKVVEVPSKGKSNRPYSLKTNRTHHFFSNLEEYYFLLSEWNPNVIDIREQYPLSLSKTIKIAESLGFRHPKNNKEPIVMTTDFLLTLRVNGKISYLARSIKPRKELEKKRTREKMKLEAMYWEDLGIDWGICKASSKMHRFSPQSAPHSYLA